MLTSNEKVCELLECTIDSVKQVMHIPVTIDGRLESFGRLGETLYEKGGIVDGKYFGC
ncbi:hypothetical protein Back11_59350 [Paenibacillus baekrokdamisoli]|uniref:Uncharacterized protein n=1 Tax=Paenibacillus baekrokdamisoli TaxID=1712516 RepID=A0A3G9J095_9BACL|nr:hypothetical protein [Paenibacillus baekrokdamisoli]BBH24590.1 hypothetical protein Back11_59350 [Paenibacillus baekrokdamisoli]